MWDNVWGFVGLDCLWHPFLSFINVFCCCSFLAVLYFHYSDQLNWDRLQMERGVSPAGLLTSQLLEMLDRLSTLRPSYLCFCVSSSSLFARVHAWFWSNLLLPWWAPRPHGGLSSNASKTSSFNFCERVFMFLPSRPSQVFRTGRAGVTEFIDVTGADVISESAFHLKCKLGEKFLSFSQGKLLLKQFRSVRGAFVLMMKLKKEESTLSCQQTSGEEVELSGYANYRHVYRVKPIDQNMGDGVFGIKVLNVRGGWKRDGGRGGGRGGPLWSVVVWSVTGFAGICLPSGVLE